MVFATLHVLVDLGQTLIDIPEQKHAQTSCSCSLTIVLALEDPVFVALLG